MVQESAVRVGDKKGSRHVRVAPVHTTRQMVDTSKKQRPAVYRCSRLLCFTHHLPCVSFVPQEKSMIVFVEHSVMEDTMLISNSGFMEVREKLKSFQDGKDDLTDKIDFIICLGGDGTLLYASLLFQVRKTTCPLCNMFLNVFVFFFFSNRFHRLWRSIWVHLDF